MPNEYNPTLLHRRLDHGGDLARVASRNEAGDWLDLSTGISPWPYPVPAMPEPIWTRLPGETLMRDLANTATRYYGTPSPACVVAAPGSQALIQLLPRLRSPGPVAVLGPTYGEHAAAWTDAGHAVELVTAVDALEHSPCDVAIVTNPNNPDGRLVEPTRLSALADRLARRDGWLVVDEAFADVAPERSLAPEVPRPGLVILRSFGKFFGLAGLRLGFALATPALAAMIEAALGPWAVSGPAAWIGARALADRAWIDAQRQHLAEAATRLDGLLRESGHRVVGGTSLFRLIETPQAEALDRALRHHHIYARRFPDQAAWLRLGLPADERAWTRVHGALGGGHPKLAKNG